MNKISVIIPTMWRSEKLEKLLKILSDCDRIGEIIIIDNDYNSKNINIDKYDKIIYLKMNENIYVNPSWNLGVSKSKFDIVAILNDDIIFDINFINNLDVDNETIIGASEQSYKDINDNNFRLEKTNNRNWGFGCIIIFNKKYYVEIPEELKIWCGDDFLFKNFNNRYIIRGVYIDTNMSTTSDIKSFDDIKKNDELIYKKNYL